MNIVACNPNGGAFKYILAGIGNAFRAAGHPFQSVASVPPSGWDLYIGCSGWQQSGIPPRSSRPGKVGIHVNPYGDRRVGSVDGGPPIDERQDYIQWVLRQEPDFVWCYCSPTFVPEYYGYWESKHGIPVIGLPTAADTTIYRPRPPQERFVGDIGWIGGCWIYKAKMMDKYLMPLKTKYKCQIFGWSPNLPDISDQDAPVLFSSAKVCPAVSESHSAVHPIDIPERVFKVPASGGFTIHTPSPAIPDLFGDDIPMASGPAEWFELIDHFIKNDDERRQQAEWQRASVLRRHTYFDRAESIARQIEAWDVAQSLVSAKSKFME